MENPLDQREKGGVLAILPTTQHCDSAHSTGIPSSISINNH